MAKKKAVNKSKEIREYLEKHPGAPAKEVQSALARRGIEFEAGFVYTVKSQSAKQEGATASGDAMPTAATKKERASGRKKPAAAKKKRAATRKNKRTVTKQKRQRVATGKKKRVAGNKATKKKVRRPRVAGLQAADLVEAKELVDKLGSFEAARQALALLEQLR